MAVTVISFPDNDINESFDTDLTFASDDFIKYVWVNIEEIVNDTHIEIVYKGITIRLDIIEECRFTPINILFQNKEGEAQTLQFFKKRTDTLDTTSEQFESDRGQPSDSFHQFVKFNVNGKARFTVSSGFVSEDLNETFKQLFLSERIWWIEEVTTPTLTPLNILSSSLEFKTRQNDRLINYEVEFEFAFNEINTT